MILHQKFFQAAQLDLNAAKILTEKIAFSLLSIIYNRLTKNASSRTTSSRKPPLIIVLNMRPTRN